MPFTLDEEAAKKQLQLNIMRGQEAVPREPNGTLREGWSGTISGGLPVRQIPHLEFPRVVYLHPNDPFQEIEHRNDRYELVGTEVVPTEHLTKIVNNDAELTAALDEGWLKEPYIPKSAPKSPGLYGPKKKQAKTA
jgi:hypothetical protein